MRQKTDQQTWLSIVCCCYSDGSATLLARCLLACLFACLLKGLSFSQFSNRVSLVFPHVVKYSAFLRCVKVINLTNKTIISFDVEHFSTEISSIEWIRYIDAVHYGADRCSACHCGKNDDYLSIQNNFSTCHNLNCFLVVYLRLQGLCLLFVFVIILL